MFKKDIIYSLIYGMGMGMDKLAIRVAYSINGVFLKDRDTGLMDQGFSVSYTGRIQFGF